MGNETELSLEETNALRDQLGLKPIPVPSKSSIKDENEDEVKEGPVKKTKPTLSNLENEISNIVDASSTERSTKNDKLNHLKRNLARFKSMNNIGNSQRNTDNQDWLNLVRKKEIQSKKVEISYEEEDSDDLPLLKTSHSLDNLGTGKNVILTLKESSVNDDDAEDVLEDEKFTQEKLDAKNIELRNMNRERRRRKLKVQLSSRDIETEEIMKDESSMLMIGAESSLVNNPKVNVANEMDSGKIKVTFEEPIVPDEDGDYMPVKIKKRKKMGTSVSTKNKRLNLPTDIRKVELIDEDLDSDTIDAAYVPSIERSRFKHSRSSSSPEELALEIRKEKEARERRSANVSRLNKVTKNLTVGENEIFLDSLKTDLVTNVPDEEPVVSLGGSQEGELEARSFSRGMRHREVEQTQPDFYDGLASTLKFLQQKNILPESNGASANQHASSDSDNRGEASKNVHFHDFKDSVNNLGFPMTVTGGLVGKNTHHAIDSGNRLQDQKLKNYDPEVNLVYKDRKGNLLTTKEAYKELSQSFHGTRTNKKKLAKKQAKIEARIRDTNIQNTNAFDIL